jgi:hypothetical protein
MSIPSSACYVMLVSDVQSTTLRAAHLQFDFSAKALEIKAIQSLKCESDVLLTVRRETGRRTKQVYHLSKLNGIAQPFSIRTMFRFIS